MPKSYLNALVKSQNNQMTEPSLLHKTEQVIPLAKKDLKHSGPPQTRYDVTLNLFFITIVLNKFYASNQTPIV